MTCNILATGSKGNAVWINRSILIDCGVPYKTLQKDPEIIGGLKIVFLTHAHGDHFVPSTIKKIHKERPSVRFACCGWMIPLLFQIGIPHSLIDYFEPVEWMSYGSKLQARCFHTLHDVPNCCWDLQLGDESLFYATDCGTLGEIEVPNRSLYLIEGNYKEEELRQRMAEKAERGEFTYEHRVEQFHLSEEQAMRFLSENAGPSSKYVLIHQHQTAQH